jgi:transcriptional regulator with XRE-family HTH domain
LGLLEEPTTILIGTNMPGSLATARYKTFTSRLIEARKISGLTQIEVAQQIGKPQSFVAKYEGGERRLDVIEVIDICAVLNANLANILQDL